MAFAPGSEEQNSHFQGGGWRNHSEENISSRGVLEIQEGQHWETGHIKSTSWQQSDKSVLSFSPHGRGVSGKAPSACDPEDLQGDQVMGILLAAGNVS